LYFDLLRQLPLMPILSTLNDEQACYVVGSQLEPRTPKPLTAVSSSSFGPAPRSAIWVEGNSTGRPIA